MAAALLSPVFGWATTRIGHLTCLTAAGLLMFLTGLDLGLASNASLLMLAGLTGMLGSSSVDVGPFAPVEQSILTSSVAPKTATSRSGDTG